MKWEMLSLESHTRQLNVILEAQKQIPLSNPPQHTHTHITNTLSLQYSANIPWRIRLGRVVVLHFLQKKRELTVTEAKPKSNHNVSPVGTLSEAHENEACTSTTNSTASFIVLW